MSRYRRAARRTRNSPTLRLQALAEQLRAIALHAAVMEKGTRNRLHGIAGNLDQVVGMLSPLPAGIVKEEPVITQIPAIRWTAPVSREAAL